MRRCAWLCLLFGPLSSALRVPSYEEEFPSDCPESGFLNLNGRYKVTRQINVTRACHLIAVPGTEIRLYEQIFFQADATFSGSWTFIGVDHVGAQARCVDVEGEARFLNATAHFTNCGGPSTEDGGGLYAEKSLVIQESQLEFRECEAIVGGSIFVQRGLYLSKSHLSVFDSKAEEFGGGIHVGRFDVDNRSAATLRNCVAAQGGGGGIVVSNGTMISDGHISLSHCVSTEGGGIALLGSQAHFLQRQGSIEVRQSRSRSAQGGCIHVDSKFEQLVDGVVILDGCATAMGAGGGLSARELNQNGTLQITDATAIDGGAIFVETTARIAGRVMTRNTTAEAYGGSIRAEMMLLLSGELRIRDSSAYYSGGALHFTSMKVAGGVVDIQNSSAMESGGAIHVNLLFSQSGGRMIIQDAKARWGGAIRSFWFGQKAGSITVRRCHSDVPDRAPGMGGGLNLLGGLFQGQDGVMYFEDVWTSRNGGAIASTFIVSRGNMTFKDVHAREEGGAVFLHKHRSSVGPKQRRFKETMEKLTEDVVEYALGGKAIRGYGVYSSDYLALPESRHVFQKCTASLGGAIHAAGAVRMKGHVEFRDVMATTVRGGAAVTSWLMTLDKPVTIINASVPNGGVFCMQRAFRASMMTFISATAPQIQCATRIRITDVSVTGTTASLMAPTRKIQRLTCDNGLEGYLDTMETGCHRCRPGFFQLQGGPEIRNDNQVSGHPCIQAPQGSEQIDQILQIRPGFMVARSNLSTSLRCPNVMACPGGQLMADQGVRDMCEHGYEGHGCVNCQKSSHGRVTNNPFACAACAERPFRKVFQWTWFILQNSGIFAISASGVLMVEQESYKSTILTNQLMSYVTVSLPVLTAVMYSQTFRNTAEIVQEILHTLQIPVEIADSGGGEGLSVQCLLGYIGLKKTLYGTDVVFAATALCLMAILGWLVDFWSAVVVGFNCFLPRICFCLGRHLVCYRMLPQAQGGEMVCGFEEDAHIPKPMACVMMVVCFVVGAGMWAVLLRYRGESSSPGVMYLTNAYTKECRMWEITVLLRKMALMAVNAILPVTLHASMQMECISVILLISLVMNHRCAPYVSKAWNNGESVLLVLALATVSLTSCYKANELDWSRSATNQKVMMIIIILMATGPAVILGIQITIALYRELTEEVPAAPAESKEPKAD